MEPKLSYFALNDLIHHEWHTSMSCRADREGRAVFRGFRGRYRLSWTSAEGKAESMECHLK